MRQAISTKYIGPTNTRGSRVKATSASGHTLTLAWADELDVDANHRYAAGELATKLQWAGTWHGGATEAGYCFVCVDGDPFVIQRSIKEAA